MIDETTTEKTEKTEKTNFSDVYAFHEKFGISGYRCGDLTKLDGETFIYRVGFLQEELTEMVNGWSNDDLEKVIDSLIDLVYVAMGTAVLMGVSPKRWEACWDEVQRANMAKVRKEPDEASIRGHAFDVVKPEGWVGPKTYVCPEWELPGVNNLEAESLQVANIRMKLESVWPETIGGVYEMVEESYREPSDTNGHDTIQNKIKRDAKLARQILALIEGSQK